MAASRRPLPGAILKATRLAKGWSRLDAARIVGFANPTTGMTQIDRWEAADPDFQPRSPLYWVYVEQLGLLEPAADAGLVAVATELEALRLDLDRLLVGTLGDEGQRTEAGLEAALVAAIRRLRRGNGGDESAETGDVP